ncbi:MAG: hypothetical protein HY786_02185 [Deltaproteobacteria bacterium]|nr:hypothetical protein [Deltaproteobacteria bacterium]
MAEATFFASSLCQEVKEVKGTVLEVKGTVLFIMPASNTKKRSKGDGSLY